MSTSTLPVRIVITRRRIHLYRWEVQTDAGCKGVGFLDAAGQDFKRVALPSVDV